MSWNFIFFPVNVDLDNSSGSGLVGREGWLSEKTERWGSGDNNYLRDETSFGNRVTTEGGHEIQGGFSSFIWTMFTCWLELSSNKESIDDAG